MTDGFAAVYREARGSAGFLPPTTVMSGGRWLLTGDELGSTERKKGWWRGVIGQQAT
jgi:hypothetical protein